MIKLKRYSIALPGRGVVLYLFLVLQIQPAGSRAQNLIGFFIGSTLNYVEKDLADRSFTNTVPRIGFSAGTSFELQLKNWLSVGVKLLFLQKNHEIRRTGIYGGIFEINRRSYIQLPVFLTIKRNVAKWQLNIDIGCYGAYWASGRLKGNIPNIFSVVTNPNSADETFPLVFYDEPYRFSSNTDNRFAFGGSVGAGCAYSLTSAHVAFINLDYYHALTGDQKKYTVNTVQAYNRTINVYAGLKIRLKK